MKFLLCFLALVALTQGKHIDLTPQIDNTPSQIIEKLEELRLNIENVDPRWVELTVNGITDKIISLVSRFMKNHGLDPMPLPDVHKGIGWSGLIIDYHGELNLTKGWAQDTSTLFRDGDSIVRIDNKLVTFKVPLGFVDLLFDYNYLCQFMGLGPEGSVDGKVINIQVYAEVTIDFEIKRITLNQFKVVDTGDISLSFHGNTIIDWLLNLISNVIVKIFDGLIYHIAENIIAGELNKIIDQINIAWNTLRPDIY